MSRFGPWSSQSPTVFLRSELGRGGAAGCVSEGSVDLVRVTGSLDEAEDLLQEAVTKALVHWGDAGAADNPAAWLVQTARNYTIDGFRRKALEKRHADK